MRAQREGEFVDNFITDLHDSLAEHCNLGALHDELIRNRIVVCITDKASSEKLQLNSKLNWLLKEQLIKSDRKKLSGNSKMYLELRAIPQARMMWIYYVKMKGKQKFTQKVNSGKEQFKQVKSSPAVTTKQNCERYNGPHMVQ